jgi:hypothetical protein
VKRNPGYNAAGFKNYKGNSVQQSIKILQDAQNELNALHQHNAKEYDDTFEANDWRNRILYADLGNGLAVEYYGEVWEEAFEIALNAICQPAVAERLTSIRFTGPDTGANGSRTHEFDSLLSASAVFPKVRDLYIRPTDVCDHNISDVADGQLSALIMRFPNLENLTLPQAPEPDFFKIKLDKLRYLRIGMGWRLYGFIRNLANNAQLASLNVLDFTDSLSVFETALPKGAPVVPTNFAQSADFLKSLGFDDNTLIDMQKQADELFDQSKDELRFDDSYTSFADYCALFESPVFKKSAIFHLRNAYLSEQEFIHLQTLRPDLQFSASLGAPHVYVSHWQGKFSKPYRHLITKNQ